VDSQRSGGSGDELDRGELLPDQDVHSGSAWFSLVAWLVMGGSHDIELVVFDMDGVLVDFYSSWVWIHDHFGTCNDDSLRSYHAGEIDDHEFIRRDVALWLAKQPRIHISMIRDILSSIPIMEGVGETISILKEDGKKCAILSGGLDILAQYLVDRFGFDIAFSNSLAVDDGGYLTGDGIVKVILNDKATPLLRLQERFGISPARTAAVGDSGIDVNMFDHAGLSIAFNPDSPYVVKHADFVVYKKDLREILKYLIC